MPRIEWLAIAPELVVAAALLVVLAVDLFLPRERKYYVAALAVLGAALAMVPVILMAVSGDTYSMFDGSYVVDSFALALKGVFLVAAYLVLLVSVSYVESDRFYQGEYYLLLLSSLLGSMVLTSARDLVVLFVALELTTGPLFLLAGWRKGDLRSNEASLKFFIIGVLSTGLMLYGMSLLFGLTGELSFSGIREAIAAGGLDSEPVLGLAVLLILVGFGFKVSAVPFHFWAPDTYQGSPPPVTAYLSVSSKLAGFVAMLAVIYLALPAVSGFWGPALWLMAAVSMTVANLSALRQTHLIRLLAYSSVAQAGFMLVPFAGAAIARDGMAEGLGATVIYLVIYAVMNLGAFAVVIAGGRRIGSYEISDWRGLGSYAPRHGVMLAVFFLSLAGLPPLAGWFAKFVMFRAVLISTGPAGVWLAVIAAVNAVVAFYYYARVVKSAWFDPAPDPVPEDTGTGPTGPLNLAMGLSLAAVLAVGAFPAIATFFGDSAAALVPAEHTAPAVRTVEYVEDAVQFYEQEGRTATLAAYNSPGSVDGDWYLVVVDVEEDIIVVHPVRSQLRGAPASGPTATDVDGYDYGADMNATAHEEGGWYSYKFPHPDTGEIGQKHSWVVRRDGLLFLSGWYETGAAG